MVPIRWVLFKAFRKNAEGLAGLPRIPFRGNDTMNSKMISQKVVMLAIGMLLMLAMNGCSDDSPVAPELESPAYRDYSPPAAPTGLSAAAVGSKVKVAWLPSTTDDDLAGYMVYRVAFGQNWPMLDAPTTETRFMDTSPLIRPCHYAVMAIDINGNESSWQMVPFQGIADRPEFNRD